MKSYINIIIGALRNNIPSNLLFMLLNQKILKFLSNQKYQDTDLLEKFSEIESTTNWAIESINDFLKVRSYFPKDRKNMNILEIGSWEGASAKMLLEIFEDSQITCIDMWKGSEAEGLNNDQFSVYDSYNKFIKNTNTYKDRVIIAEGNSSIVLPQQIGRAHV